MKELEQIKQLFYACSQAQDCDKGDYSDFMELYQKVKKDLEVIYHAAINIKKGQHVKENGILIEKLTNRIL